MTPGTAGDEGDALSGRAKAAAAVFGFVLFYATVLLVFTIGIGLRAVGPFAPAAIVVVAGIVVAIRAVRAGTPRQRSVVRWGALGFAAAMVVFGGCLGLIATGRIRIAG